MRGCFRTRLILILLYVGLFVLITDRFLTTKNCRVKLDAIIKSVPWEGRLDSPLFGFIKGLCTEVEKSSTHVYFSFTSLLQPNLRLPKFCTFPMQISF